jgi:hypothetical protein
MEADVTKFVEMFRQAGRDMGFDNPNPIKYISNSGWKSMESLF